MLNKLTTRVIRLRNLPLSRFQTSSFSTTVSRLGTSDYGSPTSAADPAANKPQEKGENPSADKEHPGPPPPQEGNNTGGGTKAQSDSPPAKKSDKLGSSGKRQFSTVSRVFASKSQSTGSKSASEAEDNQVSKNDDGKSKPKILNEKPPTGEDVPEDVRKHNEEFEKRKIRAKEGVKDSDIEKEKKA